MLKMWQKKKKKKVGKTTGDPIGTGCPNMLNCLKLILLPLYTTSDEDEISSDLKKFLYCDHSRYGDTLKHYESDKDNFYIDVGSCCYIDKYSETCL